MRKKVPVTVKIDADLLDEVDRFQAQLPYRTTRTAAYRGGFAVLLKSAPAETTETKREKQGRLMPWITPTMHVVFANPEDERRWLQGGIEFTSDAPEPPTQAARSHQMYDIPQRLYDSEINFEHVTFWDDGFAWKLGDAMNGYQAEGTSARCSRPDGSRAGCSRALPRQRVRQSLARPRRRALMARLIDTKHRTFSDGAVPRNAAKTGRVEIGVHREVGKTIRLCASQRKSWRRYRQHRRFTRRDGPPPDGDLGSGRSRRVACTTSRVDRRFYSAARSTRRRVCRRLGSWTRGEASGGDGAFEEALDLAGGLRGD